MENHIENFTITCENRGAIGFTDETEELVIPSFFVGDGKNGTEKGRQYQVTKIGQMAFSSCQNLKVVRLPETLETIFSRAFGYCVSLKNVDTSKAKKLKTISFHAFFKCSQLKTFVIPENVQNFDRLSFQQRQLCQIESKSPAYKTFQEGQILVSTQTNSVIWVSSEAREVVFSYGVAELNIGTLSQQEYVFVPKTVNDIAINAFSSMPDHSVIIIDKPKDSIPIDAKNAAVYWIG